MHANLISPQDRKGFRMKNTLHSKRRSPVYALVCTLLIVLGLGLSACDGHFLSLDCIGSSGYCGAPPPTPAGAPGMTVIASAITARAPLVSDPLSKQDAYKWAVDSTCNFRNGAYFVKYSTRSNGTYTCDTEKINMRDGAIAMDVTLFSGNSAGIIFRASHGMDNFYEFMVSQQQFVLGAFINNNATLITPPTPSGVIHSKGQKNHLLVIVQGSDFKLFINGSFVDEVHDASLQAGYVGVALAYDPSGEASFANLNVYSL